MELLRALFTLATSSSKSAISATTITSQSILPGSSTGAVGSSGAGGGAGGGGGGGGGAGGIAGVGGAPVVGAGAGGGVGPQARQAVLQIASDGRGGGGALFMTTLSLDILHPKGLEHRRSVMQLVAFLIRKVCLHFAFCVLCSPHLRPPSLSLSLPSTKALLVGRMLIDERGGVDACRNRW